MDWGKVPNGMFPFWTHDNSAVGLKAELDAGRGGPNLQSQGLLGWNGPWETLEQFDWYSWGDLTLLGWLRNWLNPKGGFLELTPESGAVCIRVCLPCCGTSVCSLPILPQSSQSRKGNTGCDCRQSSTTSGCIFHFLLVMDSPDLEMAFCHLGSSGLGVEG